MILFTADLHIKLGQKNVPVDWAINRYRMFFQQVYELEPKIDLHIIGGDIFGLATAISTWKWSAKDMQKPIPNISNHHTGQSLLKQSGKLNQHAEGYGSYRNMIGRQISASG